MLNQINPNIKEQVRGFHHWKYYTPQFSAMYLFPTDFFFFILHKLVRFCNWLACSHAQYYTTKKSACQFNFGPILKFFYGQHC